MREEAKTVHDWYETKFQLFEKSLNGESKSELHMLRKNALTRFHELGFPTTHHEEWRFTNVGPIAKTPFAPTLTLHTNGVTAKEVERYKIGHLKCSKLVFVDGQFSKDLSTIAELPQGTIIGSLASVLSTNGELVHSYLSRYARYDDNAFTALNTAFIQDGARLGVIKSGGKPDEIDGRTQPSASRIHVLV